MTKNPAYRMKRNRSRKGLFLYRKTAAAFFSGIVILSLAAAYLAQRPPLAAALKNSSTARGYVPALPDPQEVIVTAPAKEYIYAGARLIAIESGLTVSGHTRYGNNSSNLKGVSLNVTGAQSMTGTSDSVGNYLVGYLSRGGNFTLTPTKTGDVNGITSADADLVAAHAAGNITLNANQQIAADVSNNGTISGYDAALISRFVAGLSPAGNTGTWKFAPLSRTYSSLAEYQPNQDFDGILMGDVSGDWIPPSSHHATIRRAIQPSAKVRSVSANPATLRANPSTVRIELPTQSARQGSTCTISISTSDLTGLNVLSYLLDLTFDPSVITPQASSLDDAGTVSIGMRFATNKATPGHLVIAATSAAERSGSGKLLKLKFNVVGTGGSTTSLTWQSLMFNEGDPEVTLTNGQVTVQ